ncbi:MAG: FtsX-like permease family protein [Alphaproteobacteria bacterium]
MTASVLAIAWRNVIRNRRRSLLTAAAIAIGLAALLFLWGFNDGAHNNMMRNYQAMFVGSLQVHKSGFFQRPKLATHIAAPEPITAALEAAGIARWSRRLTSFALAVGAESSAGMLLVGVEPEREPRVSNVATKVVRGRFLEPGDWFACLLGEGGARKLEVELGGTVILLSQDRQGGLAAERFTLVGIVAGSDPAFDKGMVLAPLGAVQEMLVMGARVTDIVALVPEERLDEVAAGLRRKLLGQDLEVLRWFDMFPIMREWVALDNGFYYIFLGIVLLIVVAGVTNTVLVSMIERTREFGVLMALGTRRLDVATIVVTEALIIGVVGTALGTALGLATVVLYGHLGIDLSEMTEGLSRFYMDPVIYTEIDTDHLAVTVLATFVAAAASALYPALKAIRLEPVEAIRRLG